MMRVDGTVMTANPEEMPAAARELEELGYDGVFTAETSHDPFLPIALAALETERIELATGIAVAFARNPMSTAVIGNDLQLYTKGRFILGLGSQIKPHIEKRFSMPWSEPAKRMREFILAMRAIWACWNDGDKLDFRGQFYRHTLMTPFFNPGPNPYRAPPVFLAAVGERMTEVAGEVADGILLHGFTTERYVREVTMPALERGWARAGTQRGDFGLAAGRQATRRLRAVGTDVRGHRHQRGGVRGSPPRHEAADRVLRFDARVPGRPRAARLGGPPAGPQPLVAAGR